SITINVRQVYSYISLGPVSTDLRIFMTGVEMARTGHGHELYRFKAQETVQNRLYPQTRTAGLLPFNHFPYHLLFYCPLPLLPFRVALLAWALINLGIVIAIARLL